MKKSFLLLSIGLCASSTLWADTGLTLSRTLTMPSQIIVGYSGISEYTITNNFGFELPGVVMGALPAGVTVMTGTGLCSFPQDLANGSSCTLRLAYAGAVNSSFTDNSFSVCPDSSCQWPSSLTPDQATTTTVVSSAQPSMPTLTSSTSSLSLIAGATASWTVTNTGSVTADNITATIPAALSPYINTTSSVTSCLETAPGATCTLSLAVENTTLPETLTGELTVQGANTQAVVLTYNNANTALTANAPDFLTPGTQNLELTNSGNTTITVSAVSLSTDVHGVSVGDIATCADLAVGTSCSVPLTASATAYGTGTATITYAQANNSNQTLDTTVTVAATTVLINNGDDISGHTADPGTGSFHIANTGAFTWVAPNVTHDPSDTWLAIDATDCAAGVIAGNYCTVSYHIAGEHDLASFITANGANIATTTANFIPDANVSIGLESDPDSLHLGYRAIRINNLTTVGQELTNITADPPASMADKIILCDVTGSNCSAHYQSTCLTGHLAPDPSPTSPPTYCYFWYKANTSTTLQPSVNDTVSISVTAIPDTTHLSEPPLTKNVKFVYNNSLYVGGNFTQAGSGGALNIARWDGAHWSPLVGGLNSESDALTLMNGDLYAGGSFSLADGSAASGIAKWNGTAWSGLGTGLNAGGSIKALAAKDDVLYAGGTFTQMDKKPATNIAQWNGTEWSAVGGSLGNPAANGGPATSVNALTIFDNTLYAGGSFTTPANYLAKWDGTIWTAVGNQ